LFFSHLSVYLATLNILSLDNKNKNRFFILYCPRLYVYLQTNRYLKGMTAIQLRTELFREISPLLDNESAMEKMLTFIRSLSFTKSTKAETKWADRFVGAWEDDRTADEIVSDIRSARQCETLQPH